MTGKNAGAMKNGRVSRHKSDRLLLIFKVVLICLAVCFAVLVVLPDSRATMANQWEKLGNWFVKSDGYVLAVKIFGGVDGDGNGGAVGKAENGDSDGGEAVKTVSGDDTGNGGVASQIVSDDGTGDSGAASQAASGIETVVSQTGNPADTSTGSLVPESADSGVVPESAGGVRTTGMSTEHSLANVLSGGVVPEPAGGVKATGMTTEPLPAYVPDGVQDYESLFPNLYAERAKEWIIENKTVFLTFDDGPSIYTETVLDILKDKDVKATFFVVGNSVKKQQKGSEILNRIVNEGHTLAIHCNYHEYKTLYKSVESFLEDFNTVYELIYDTTGIHADIFRFPGGSNTGYNKAIRSQLMNEMERRGFTFYDWNASTGDSSSAITVESAYENALAKSKSANRLIILIHDTKKASVDALAGIIDRYKELDFSFGNLLNEDKPIVL